MFIVFLAENFPDFFLVSWFASVVKLELVTGSPHTKDFEAIDLGDELWCASWRKLGIVLQEHMWKRGPKVGTIDVKLFLTGNVDVLASRAVDLHSRS